MTLSGEVNVCVCIQDVCLVLGVCWVFVQVVCVCVFMCVSLVCVVHATPQAFRCKRSGSWAGIDVCLPPRSRWLLY